MSYAKKYFVILTIYVVWVTIKIQKHITLKGHHNVRLFITSWSGINLKKLLIKGWYNDSATENSLLLLH